MITCKPKATRQLDGLSDGPSITIPPTPDLELTYKRIKLAALPTEPCHMDQEEPSMLKDEDYSGFHNTVPESCVKNYSFACEGPTTSMWVAQGEAPVDSNDALLAGLATE